MKRDYLLAYLIVQKLPFSFWFKCCSGRVEIVAGILKEIRETWGERFEKIYINEKEKL